MNDSPEFLKPSLKLRSGVIPCMLLIYHVVLLNTIMDQVHIIIPRFILLVIQCNCDPSDGSLIG